MKWLFAVLTFLIVGYLGAMGYIYFTQDDQIFDRCHCAPTKDGFYISNNNAKIWIETRNKGKEKALLYFPGNTEDAWDQIDEIASNLPNHTIYFMHYRGYSKSSGKPSDKLIYSDDLKLYDTVAPKHKVIDVIGRSLGTSSAVYVAANRAVNRLVLTTPFDSLVGPAKMKYPYFPIDALIKYPFPSSKFAPKISAKTLIIECKDDQVVPNKSTQKLIKSFDKSKPIVKIISNTTHHSIVDNKEYFKYIDPFLR